MSTEFSVHNADWATAARKLQHVRRTVFIVEQQVPEDLEWDEAGCLATGPPKRRTMRLQESLNLLPKTAYLFWFVPHLALRAALQERWETGQG